MQASGAEYGGFEQALGTRAAFFIYVGVCPKCSGGFSLQRDLCFHLVDQWQRTSTAGSILESFWEPNVGRQKLNYTHCGVSQSQFWVAKWGVVLKVTFCGLPVAGRILRTRLVEGNLGALGPLILNPTDCHRRQDTGYKIQDTGYSIQHTHSSIQQ